jgi:hypothetical protein
MARSDLPNLTQKIKLRAIELFPDNRIYSHLCNGVLTWYEQNGDVVMEHDLDDPPDDEYLKECLGDYYK